jgi:hypothetical protein
MTLQETTVFLERENGGNTADAYGYKHDATEAGNLKVALVYIYICIYMTENQF